MRKALFHINELAGACVWLVSVQIVEIFRTYIRLFQSKYNYLLIFYDQNTDNLAFDLCYKCLNIL